MTMCLHETVHCGDISIHAPRVGSDLSTTGRKSDPAYFNPRSPCGERPGQGRIPRPVLSISIHAPRVGSDVLDLSSSHTTSLFQSTLPVWGATWCWLLQWPYPLISIHAPRVGSDHKQRVGEVLIPKISIHAPRVGSDPADCGAYKQDNHFNPRSPCGERPRWALLRVSLRIFQSTLPVWGATHTKCLPGFCKAISIHAPRVGSDVFKNRFRRRRWNISIHAPRVGSDFSGSRNSVR